MTAILNECVIISNETERIGSQCSEGNVSQRAAERSQPQVNWNKAFPQILQPFLQPLQEVKGHKQIQRYMKDFMLTKQQI